MMNEDTELSDPSGYFDRTAMYRHELRALEENTVKHQLVTPQEAQQHVANGLGKVLSRYDLLSTEARALVDLDALGYGPAPTAEQRAQWREQAKEALLKEYGPDRVGQAMSDARAFARQDPQLRVFLNDARGDHPALLQMLARKGTAARKAGKLK